MKTTRFVTPDDSPDWSRAFDGEASYPLAKRFRGHAQSEAWFRTLVLAHAVGAAEAQA